MKNKKDGVKRKKEHYLNCLIVTIIKNYSNFCFSYRKQKMNGTMYQQTLAIDGTSSTVSVPLMASM